MKTFKKFIKERSMTSRQKLVQMQHYWDDLDHMASDETKKKSMETRFGLKNIKLDKKGGKLISFDEGNKSDTQDMYALMVKGLKAMPGSPKQKEIIKQINVIRKRMGMPLMSEDRDYKDEYKKFQSSEKMRKYRGELNKYNREKGTYGNGDGKDASHKDGKIIGMEDENINRGRAEKSRLVGSKRK
tara:strand:+ start:269 stop:826 length:558 start_codon:yes stop_codon:yes gene_type:complete